MATAVTSAPACAPRARSARHFAAPAWPLLVRRRMRVLHVVGMGRPVDGHARQVAALRASGVEVVVAAPRAGAGLMGPLRRAGASVVETDLGFTPSEPWLLAGALHRCRHLVESVRPDLVHCHVASTTLLVRLALGRAHPTPRLSQVRRLSDLAHPALRRLDVVTSGPRDAWVASSRWMQQQYVDLGVPAERVFVSYGGVDPERLAGGTRGQFRRSLGIGPATALVGTVASLRPARWLVGQMRAGGGHEDFIEALRRVTRARPNVVGVIVGGAPARAARYEQRLRALAREACGTAVRFVGAREDVAAVYRDLDVAVHPARVESGEGPAESLAAACPTVATDVGGHGDVVVQGRTGWLVRPAEPERLASAVLQALADPEEARRRAQSGQELVADLYDVERTAHEVLAIYRRLLSAAGAPVGAPLAAALAG